MCGTPRQERSCLIAHPLPALHRSPLPALPLRLAQAQLKPEAGGLGGKSYVLTCGEGNFPSRRLRQIAASLQVTRQKKHLVVAEPASGRAVSRSRSNRSIGGASVGVLVWAWVVVRLSRTWTRLSGLEYCCCSIEPNDVEQHAWATEAFKMAAAQLVSVRTDMVPATGSCPAKAGRENANEVRLDTHAQERYGLSTTRHSAATSFVTPFLFFKLGRSSRQVWAHIPPPPPLLVDDSIATAVWCHTHNYARSTTENSF